MAAALDFDASYTLPPDVMVVERDETTVQVGTEPPRRTLIVDAPRDAARLFDSLTPERSLGHSIGSIDGDPLVWRGLLERLFDAGLLIQNRRTVRHPPQLLGERLALTHRYGSAAAHSILLARADAVVVVDGADPLANAVSTLMVMAGVGNVHQPSLASTRGSTPRKGGAAIPRQRSTDWATLPEVRTQPPAAQIRPSAVVLAGTLRPDLTRAAELAITMVPHIAAYISQARIVVGPLVLPGRSPCLNCVERDKLDRDPGWQSVAATIRARPIPPAALGIHAAAELVADQVLTLIDGQQQPDALGVTLERQIADRSIRRRPWVVHPDCGCRYLSG